MLSQLGVGQRHGGTSNGGTSHGGTSHGGTSNGRENHNGYSNSNKVDIERSEFGYVVWEWFSSCFSFVSHRCLCESLCLGVLCLRL